MNPCFVDSNKRMAMGCAFIYLDWNGFEINASGEDSERFLIEKVILGKADVGEISKWLACQASPLASAAATAAPARKTPGKRRDENPAMSRRQKSR